MFAAFDLKTDKLIPDNGDLSNLGIVCASICKADGTKVSWVPEQNEFRQYGGSLTQEQVYDVVDFLYKEKKVVTWNGIGFDLQVLYHCCKGNDTAVKKLIKLAKRHVDIAYCFLCEHGYMISLNRVPSYDDKVDSKTIPALWSAGRLGQDMVIAACRYKSSFLACLFDKVASKRRLEYLSKAGAPLFWTPILFKDRPLSVKNASVLDLPDNSFLPEDMQEMFRRDRFVGWIGLQ
jgi:hypothetical protein